MRIKRSVLTLGCSLGLSLGLIACDTGQSPHEQLMSSEAVHSDEEKTPQATPSSEGRKLSDVAGQANLPRQRISSDSGATRLSEYEQQFVGRYHTKMSCEDSLTDCEHGNSEYILNLLPDGTAHRMIVHYGKVYAENTSQQSSRYNRAATWIVNRELNEVVVYPKDSYPIFYRIESNQRLVMNVEKILSVAENSPAVLNPPLFVPSQDYVLLKDPVEAEHK